MTRYNQAACGTHPDATTGFLQRFPHTTSNSKSNSNIQKKLFWGDMVDEHTETHIFTVAVHDDDDDDVDDQEGHLLPLMLGHESHCHPRASSGFKLGWLLIVSFAWHASETLQCLTLSSNFYISCPSIGIFFSFSLVVFVNTTGVTNITHWSSLIIIIIIMDLHQLHEECQNGEFDALQGLLWSIKQKSKSKNSAARFWAESSI